MRRSAAVVVLSLIPPLAVVLAAAPPAAVGTSAVAAPSVKQVVRAFGDGPVRLAPRQGVDLSFTARRGDRVMLEVASSEERHSPCFGVQSLVDARGRRTARLEPVSGTKVFTVRTTGRAVLSFRGRCSHGTAAPPEKVRAQLTKVRALEVQRDGRTRVREPRQGYVDIAYVRVAQDGRDTLTLRTADGSLQEISRGRILVGNRVKERFSWPDDPAVSVEAGQRYVLDHPHTWETPMRRGQVVGIVVGERGYAESLQAHEHRVALDEPPLTLPAEPGREHVLVYEATPEDRAYVIPLGLPSQSAYLSDANLDWGTWRHYTAFPDRDDPLQRTVVYSDRAGTDPATQRSQQVRVRRTVRVPDLVVGGAPVTFTSAEPGTRFVSSIPVSVASTVRLTASNAATTGPWETDVPPVRCYFDSPVGHGDCNFTGLTVRPDQLVADGVIDRVRPNELLFYFEPNASGSVTLALTDIP